MVGPPPVSKPIDLTEESEDTEGAAAEVSQGKSARTDDTNLRGPRAANQHGTCHSGSPKELDSAGSKGSAAKRQRQPATELALSQQAKRRCATVPTDQAAGASRPPAEQACEAPAGPVQAPDEPVRQVPATQTLQRRQQQHPSLARANISRAKHASAGAPAQQTAVPQPAPSLLLQVHKKRWLLALPDVQRYTVFMQACRQQPLAQLFITAVCIVQL